MQNNYLLVTGGAGFIGCHLVEYLLESYSFINVVNLDALTYAADLSKLEKYNNNERYIFIEGNIYDPDLVSQIFKDYKIDGVIHLAAESHVDKSIVEPKIFFETNVMGTQNLLDKAREYWLDKPGKIKEKFVHARFLHVSTDEVYGTLGHTGYFTEETPYSPNSPYSASKAGGDFAARSYFHTYRLPVVISHCCNNFGPGQHDEKLIPTIVRNALNRKEIPIYGNGRNIRDWLYVQNHCDGLDVVFQKGILGESYNIGDNNEYSNIEMATLICSILDELIPQARPYSEQIIYVQDREGHDFRYAINNKKICSNLGWFPKGKFSDNLRKTVEWYAQKYTK